MTQFYLGAVVLILLSLVFSLWPWLQQLWLSRHTSQDVGDDDRRSFNIALYHDHLQDLESAQAQGSVDTRQFQQLKKELARNLLEDSGAEPPDSTDIGKHPITTITWLALAVAIVLPVSAWFLYQELGSSQSWQIKQKLDVQSQLENQLQVSGSSIQIEQQLNKLNRKLVADLDAYVSNHPDSLDIQVLLARNAIGIGNYDKAIETYQQILEREPRAAQMMAELAQAIFFKADGQAVPFMASFASQALSIQPKNVMALGLMGIYSFQQSNYQDAIEYWEQAIVLYPPGSANVRALQNGLAQAQSRLQETDPSKEMDNHQQAGEARIKVAVSLGQSVSANSEHSVFIYARAWQGPKMPLAITRITVAQLPLTLELNDSMAMAPGMNLSSVEQVELVARISSSDNAVARPEDLQVTLGPVKPSAIATSVYPLIITKTIGDAENEEKESL